MIKIICNLFLACLLLYSHIDSSMADEKITPKGDLSIHYLAFANLHCAVIKHVNPEALNDSYSEYLRDSNRLKSIYFGKDTDYEGTFSILTAEKAIKTQGMRSIAGANKWLSKSLLDAGVDTGTKDCHKLRPLAENVLKMYDLKL